MISTFSLQSGSNGNSIYVETPDARLLFDAGLSGRAVRDRLSEHDRDVADIDALLISHNHSDHVSGAGVLNRAHGTVLYMTHRTWAAAKAKLGAVTDVHRYLPGADLRFGNTLVQTIGTPHDGKGPVIFVVCWRGKRLGVFTDLGHRFGQLDELVGRLDALYLESNYDPEMLENGPYPSWLKKRIVGDGGHLSNLEAAQLVRDCGQRLQLLILAHLSEQNNHPDLAMTTARSNITGDLPIAVASRTAASRMFVVS